MNIENKPFAAGPGLRIFDLTGKGAIVTGAGSGLGREVAIGLAMSGAGVALLDCRLEPIDKLAGELNGNGYRALACAADVTDAAQLEEAVSKAAAFLGGADVLVNCAGITRRMPLEDFTEADWDAVIGVNLKGTFLTNRIVGRRMLEAGKGSIVNIGSIGSVVAVRNSAAYCASKGGVAQLTKTAAVEWAHRGVRVNAILPGTFETPLLRQCIAQNPSYEREMLGRYPMGRFGKPEEIVGACVFLASDASSYVTGHLLYVDGGCIAY